MLKSVMEAGIHIQIQGIDHAKCEVDASFLKNNPSI